MPVLKIDNLTKRYGSITAVDGLSLTVEQGEVYGILGPNGSGKTTTLGAILGIIRFDSGSYTWFDDQYGKTARQHIGAMLETPNFYPYMNAVQNLEIVAHIKKSDKADFDELLGLVDLTQRKTSKFQTYSLGMKQRLAIAAAMVGNPKVLIFDEPTNGLDPQGIADVRTTLKRIASQGTTILMASHILDEVEKVCSHVAIIKKGKLLATGPVGSILSDDISIEIDAENRDALFNFLEGLPDVSSVVKKGNHFLLQIDETMTPAKLNQLAAQQGIYLTHLVAKAKSLESEFLEITQKQNN